MSVISTCKDANNCNNFGTADTSCNHNTAISSPTVSKVFFNFKYPAYLSPFSSPQTPKEFMGLCTRERLRCVHQLVANFACLVSGAELVLYGSFFFVENSIPLHLNSADAKGRKTKTMSWRMLKCSAELLGYNSLWCVNVKVLIKLLRSRLSTIFFNYLWLKLQ